jgi:hypothetical protein
LDRSNVKILRLFVLRLVDHTGCYGASSVRTEDMRVLLVNRVGDTGYRFRAMYGRCARCLMKVKIEAFQAFGRSSCTPGLS